jgi:hypothetical protein
MSEFCRDSPQFSWVAWLDLMFAAYTTTSVLVSIVGGEDAGRTHLENTAENSAFVIPSLSRNLWNLTDKKFEIPRKLGMTGSCKCNHPGRGWLSFGKREGP